MSSFRLLSSLRQVPGAKSNWHSKSISSCTYLEAKSEEHIQSLLPLPNEFKSFRDLTTASLKLESSLPPLIIRYIYRYIHSHDLYQISTSNFKVFSELVSLLITNSGLPKTDAATREIVTRCKSVIETAAQAWTNQGLLVVNGEILRKSTVFKRVWDTEVQTGGKVNRKQDGVVKDGQNLTKHAFVIVAAEEVKDRRQKKRVHFARPESSTNIVRTNDIGSLEDGIGDSNIQLVRHGYKEIVGAGATGGARLYSPSAEIPDVGECIVVGVGEISREEMELYGSSNNSSELPLVDRLSTTNPSTGQHHQRTPPLPCSRAGIGSHRNTPTLLTSSGSVVDQEGTTAHEAFSTLTASQTHGDRCRPSGERATACVERASLDAAKTLLVYPMSFTNQATSHDNNTERSRRARPAISTYNIKTLSAQAQGKSPRKRKAREIVGNEDDDETSGMTVTFSFGRADAAEYLSNKKHIVVTGLRCVFCDRNHTSLDALRFHLNHDHENFKFSLRRQSSGRISFFVEVLKSRSHLEADGRIFQLGKCATPFNLETYPNGDRSWVKARQGPYHNHWPDHFAVGKESGFKALGPHQSSLEKSLHPSRESSPNASSRSTPMDLEAVGKSRRKVLLVPKTAKPLYHTITKRRLQPGEELPDSEDEKDECWFQQKRGDMINDFEDADIDPGEKEYLNTWNRFASKTHTIDVLLPDTVDGFVKTHKKWLAQPARTQKFMAHMGVLILRGVVKEKMVSKWTQVIQEAKDEDPDLNPDEVVETDPPEIKYRGMADCICLEHAPLHNRVVCVGATCQGRMFHQECALKLGVPSAPRGRWMCDKCIEQGAESLLAWP